MKFAVAPLVPTPFVPFRVAIPEDAAEDGRDDGVVDEARPLGQVHLGVYYVY